jgi:hypothetical protein
MIAIALVLLVVLVLGGSRVISSIRAKKSDAGIHRFTK